MLEIFKSILGQIDFAEIETTVMVGAVGTVAYKLRPYVVELLSQLIAYGKLKVSQSEYSEIIKKAYDIWKLVDENFRIEAKVIESFKSKADYFDSLLLKEFPSLTQDDVDNIRQIIAGTVNADKTDDETEKTNTINDLNTTVITLNSENEELKAKLAQVQSVATVITVDSNTIENSTQV